MAESKDQQENQGERSRNHHHGDPLDEAEVGLWKKDANSDVKEGGGDGEGQGQAVDEFWISPESRHHLVRNYILFAFLGAGANWLLPMVLFQEIPWFQDRVPEGLCLATYLNTVNSFALLVTLTYVTLNHYYKPISHSIMMPIILWISVFATFFVAFTHSITSFGVSICLLISSFFGAIVGSLSAVIFNPFMTQFENIYITAARSGASGSYLLCALLGIAQGPGSNTRFNPTVFLLIFGVLFFLPIYAYHRIINEKIGYRVPAEITTTVTIELQQTTPSPNTATSTTSTSSVSTTGDSNRENPIHHSKAYSEKEDTPLSEDPSSSFPSSNDPHNLKQGEQQDRRQRSGSGSLDDHYHETDRMLHCIETQSFPWLRFTLPYALSIGFVQFNTWGMLTAVTPFAMEHVSTSSVSGSFLLALAYEIGCFTLVAGDISTVFFHFPFKILVPLFGILSFIIYIAALNAPGFRSNESVGYLLVVIFSLGRFIESHIVTECFRVIATSVPKKYREDASRLLGIADQVFTVLGVITSSVLVSQLASEC